MAAGFGATLAIIGEIAAVASAAASISATAYAATQSGPKVPNAASSSRRVAEAQAAALPIQRGLSAAEQQGGSYSGWDPKHKESKQFVRYKMGTDSLMDRVINGSADKDSILGAFASGGLGPLFGLGDKDQYAMIEYKPEDWQEGGKYYNAKNPDFALNHIVTRNVKVKGQNKTYDFSGYGTADIQGEMARQFADIQNELGAKYGTQFAEEARREAELADPQAFAARRKELDLIQQGIDNPLPINPMATTLDQRMTERLKAGSGLDSMSQEALDAAINNANASRGGSLSREDVAHSLSTGVEGAARRQAAIQQALGYVQSGVSPADVQYRREQQNLGNLASFIQGRTPESQFPSLSGAGSAGATPFAPGQQLPQLQNAGAGGPQYALSSWQRQLNQQNQQTQGWTAGLSLLSGIGALGKATG